MFQLSQLLLVTVELAALHLGLLAELVVPLQLLLQMEP
jgi:hypothetical protein